MLEWQAWRIKSLEIKMMKYSIEPSALVYLFGQAYFAEEKRRGITKLGGKKLIPQCERIAALEREAQQLREMMTAFQARQSELYNQLWRDVANGIDSRQVDTD